MLKRGFLSYAGGGAVAGAPAATRSIAVSAAAGGGVGSIGTVSASYGISIAIGAVGGVVACITFICDPY